MAKYPGSFFINEVGTRKDLANIYGVSERTIYRWLNKAAEESGLSPKVTKKRHPRPETLVNFKGTRKALAKKYNVSERTAYRWLKKAREKGTPIPSRQSQSNYPGSAVIMDIIANSAKTNKQIAEEFGVSTRTVSSWIRRAKLESPPLVPDLRKTKEYKLRRKKTENGNWVSWYEYVGAEAAEDVGEPWEAPEPEQPEDVGEPWEVPEDIDEDLQDLNLTAKEMDDLSSIADMITELDLLSDYSMFNDFSFKDKIKYLNEYIMWQMDHNPDYFYDKETGEFRTDPDWLSEVNIWGDEFETWLVEQRDSDLYEI